MKSKTRLLTVAGWMGETCKVTVEGGTLVEAKRTARREAHSLLRWPALRPVVVNVEVLP